MDDSAKVFEQCVDVAPEEFPAPIGKLLGLTIISSGIGRATVEFEATGRYANPMGRFTAEYSAMSPMLRWALPTTILSRKARRSPLSN